MPSFDDIAVSSAPPEEVWKALYDPSRFVDWWAGIESVVPGGDERGGDITIYPDGYPDFPMPQSMTVSQSDQRVTISCLVSFIAMEWRLAPRDDGGTDIAVHVTLPEEEAHRLDDQRRQIGESIVRLAEVARSSP
jgi:uncharacterized protein YndB with AHSA1/START domain